MQIDTTIITGLGAILTIVGTMLGTTWRMRAEFDRRDAYLTKMLTDHELADERRFAEIKTEIFNSSDTVRQQFGETGQAIREKVREFEIWARDHFVQTKTFERAFDQISQQLNVVGKVDDLTAKFNNFEKQ